MSAWLGAFALTQLVEVPIYLRALRGRLAWAFGLSLLTHPIVFFVFPRLVEGPYWAMVSMAEAFAVAVEAALLSALGVERSLWWALLANGCSVAASLLTRSLIGWP